jgi:HTH-type transcriptional regulator/antitoxin HipB
MKQLVYSPESLGKAIQRYRKLLNLSQVEAGLPFNITQSVVSGIENGSPGVQIDTIFRMLAALDLEMIIRSKKENKNKNAGEW